MFGTNPEQRAVAGGLTNAFTNTNLGTETAPNGNADAIVTAFNNTKPAAILGVLDSLSGEGIAAAQNLAHRSAELFTSSISDQTTFYGSDRRGANQIVLTSFQPGSRPFGAFEAMAPQDTLKGRSHRHSDPRAGRPARTPPAVHRGRPVAPVRTRRAWGTGFGADEDVRSNAAIGFAAQQNSIVGGSVGVDRQITPAH